MASDHAPLAAGGQEIVLDNVTKTYPDQDQPAVDRVSMTIPAGEIVVLVGPSGCGKTTTMKMINRLIEPSSGRITIGGTDVLKLDVDQHRRNIAYVIQQIGLFPHMRVRDNVGLVPGLVGWDRARIRARVDKLLELVGLSADYGRRYPRELSGGQQQRVGVARALAADPPVMLMDEPFGATDPITREHLQDEFRRLQLQLRKTIVFVTHDFAEALKLGDRIAVLRPQSVIAQYDTPAEILARPADAYVESFIGAGPNLKKLTLLPLRGATLEPVGCRVAAQQLTPLEDDKHFFPIYNPCITIRTSVAEKYPQLEPVFTAIAQKLTTPELTALNKKVSVDGEKPDIVATEWLKSAGFIG